jgi:hypothetical protein
MEDGRTYAADLIDTAWQMPGRRLARFRLLTL